MNILLLGHRDIASNVALSIIASALPRHRFEIMLSGEVPSRGDTPPALAALSACEKRMCDGLRGAVAADRAAPRSFRALAGGREPRILDDPNSPSGLGMLVDLKPDLVISVRYRRILREEAIAAPRHGVLNLHSGLLPDYKGMMATFWAMLNGEATMGCTAHYIVDGGIDTGPIVGRAPLAVQPGRTYLANVLSLYPSGCAMLIDAVRCIERGKPVACTAQPQAGRYYSAPAADDIARFERAGLRLFDGHELQHWGRTSAST